MEPLPALMPPASAAAHCPAARVGEKQTLQGGDAMAAREDGMTVFARGRIEMGVGLYVTYADCDGTANATGICWKACGGSS